MYLKVKVKEIEKLLTESLPDDGNEIDLYGRAERIVYARKEA